MVERTERGWKPTSEDYARANVFLRRLKASSLTPQQKKTLRGLALNGDLSGARRGLEKLERGGGG